MASEEDDLKPQKRSTSYEWLPPKMTDDLKPLRRSSSYEWLPPQMSELRVVLLGNSWSQRSSVGNFILGQTVFNTEKELDYFLRISGPLEKKKIVLINTPDLLHPDISEDKLTEHVKTCQRLSDPGPHVFLLVLQPEDFTEEHNLKLCRVLQRFSDQSFDHSLILISAPREESPGFMEKYQQHPALKEMIRKCRYRFLWQKNLELPELLTRLGQVMKEKNGEDLNIASRTVRQPPPGSHESDMTSSSSNDEWPPPDMDEMMRMHERILHYEGSHESDMTSSSSNDEWLPPDM